MVIYNQECGFFIEYELKPLNKDVKVGDVAMHQQKISSVYFYEPFQGQTGEVFFRKVFVSKYMIDAIIKIVKQIEDTHIEAVYSGENELPF